MRTLLHLLSAALLLTIYGGQVCPFLESLTLLQLALPISTALAILYVLIQPASTLLVDIRPLPQRPARLFWVILLLFLIAGLVLAEFNRQEYGFPFGSGIKLLTGFLLLGVFAALDLSLERAWIQSLLSKSVRFSLDRPGLPLPLKLNGVATMLVVLVTVIFFLVFAKDLDWIVAQNNLESAKISVIKEFLFVAAVIVGHLFNLALSYTKLLNLQLYRQEEVLSKVAAGDLSQRLPVISADELGRIAQGTNRMIAALEKSNRDLAITQEVTILSLASLAETRDPETGRHLLRTQRFVKALAEELADRGHHVELLTRENIELIYKSAPLHDIGKVGIPDHILLKPGRLTPEEFEQMKQHAAIGARALENGALPLGETGFLHFAKEIALSHHEKWDGTGYPAGLQGEAIPLSGRLMAVADVYDALRMRRVYKEPMTHEQAKEIIVGGRGQHFDPALVDCFLAREEEFIAIEQELRDPEEG